MKLYLPLRLKFLILVITAFLIALATMTMSSRSLYLQDKESYLYEDMLTSVENDSGFINSYIDSKIIITKSIFSNAIIKKNKDSSALIKFPKEFFLDNPSLIDFHIYRYGNRELLLEDEVENRGIKELVDEPQKLFLSANKMQPFMFEAVDIGFKRDVHRGENGVVQLRVGFYDKRTRFAGFFRFALSVQLAKINFGQSYSKVLLDGDSQSLYSQLSQYDERKKFDFRKYQNLISYIDDGNLKTGVKAIRIAGEKYLIAFRNFTDLNLKYLSLISEKKAYATTQVLLVRMLKISFFVFVSMTILIFIFSNSITKSIKELIKATNDAKEGKYRQSIKINTGDEVGVLVSTFNEMITQVQVVTSKLHEANKNLENKVIARTEELRTSNDFIKAMVNSLDQGLFVFTGKGKILPIYTKACEGFFGENFNLKPLTDLLPFTDSETAQRVVKAIFAEQIPFESVAALAPKEIGPANELVDEDDFFKATLDYFPMRNSEGFIQFVVVVVTDITKEYRAKVKFDQHQNYVERILKISASKNNFLVFLQEAADNINIAKSSLNSGDQVFDFDTLMRTFHSIKGMAGQYSANELALFVHNAETQLSNYQDKGKAEREEYLPTLVSKLVEMEKLIDNIKSESKVILGPSLEDGIAREEIPRPDLKKFNTFLMEKVGSSHPEVVNAFESQFLKVPVRDYFHSYDSLVQELSSELGKSINPIEFENGDILVDRVYYQQIFNNFVHIFRNIVDHGIESPSLRVDAGKASSGSIKIEFEIVHKKIEIRIKDDGGGIDPDKVREKMRDNGYEESVLSKDNDKIIEHIFDSNFSTRQEVSGVSGRGVGMDAVKSIVVRNGGAARVASQLGVGTTFLFRLPLQ